MIFVFNRDDGSGKGKLAADLFVFKVRNGSAVFNFPQAGGGSRDMQEGLCEHGLPARTMRDEGNVSDELGSIFFHVQTSMIRWDASSGLIIP